MNQYDFIDYQLLESLRLYNLMKSLDKVEYAEYHRQQSLFHQARLVEVAKE